MTPDQVDLMRKRLEDVLGYPVWANEEAWPVIVEAVWRVHLRVQALEEERA
jgi:hypothetical protein